MIPTYNCTELFEATLRAVLDQDPGPNGMQIAVVDDCSTSRRYEEVVRALAPDRVELYRQPANRGLAGNWNTCLEHSRGRWVHILHHDDLVLPGFYERLARAGEHPDVGAAFCRHSIIDGNGCELIRKPLERPTAGVLGDWLRTIAHEQHVQCASIVVRREVYEWIGGFRDDLCFALDWEMWVRIAAACPVWYEPELLALYRIHENSQTDRLSRRGLIIPDMLKSIRIVSSSLPPAYQGSVGRLMIAEYRDTELRSATQAFQNRDLRTGIVSLMRAIQLDPSLCFRKSTFDLSKWALKIALTELLSRVPGLKRLARANNPEASRTTANGLPRGSSQANCLCEEDPAHGTTHPCTEHSA
jgi:glycosyltransferase involved in cell wall biosynthesis